METKMYSLEEIAKNDGKNDNRAWIIIKNSVYDVTDYLEDHPGGGDLITEWAGKDGTKAFDEFGHSGDAKKDLKTLKIGEVREEDRTNKKQQKQSSTPKVVEASVSEKEDRRSCMAIITCGICGA